MNPLSESPATERGATRLPVAVASLPPQALHAEADAAGVTLFFAETQVLALRRTAPGRPLSYRAPYGQAPADEARLLVAALEGWFALAPEALSVDLEADRVTPGLAHLAESGVLLRLSAQQYRCHAEVLWQLPALWLPEARQPYPQHQVTTAGVRHPRRPPHPTRTLYRRFIPWLGQTLTLEPVDIDTDLPAFNRWMNTPRVARFWNETGSLDDHRHYLQTLLASAHSFPIIGRFDGVPFGYFEAYWAREDRIAPYYDAQDYDRGLHLLVGEEAYRGQAFYTAWFSSLCHFAFLADPRTQRVVCEPSHDNRRQLSNFDRSGFARIKSFDFPHKRATLVMLSREHFFHEHLFHPLAAPRGTRHFSRS